MTCVSTVPDWCWLVLGAVTLFGALQFLWQQRRTPESAEGLLERLARLAWSLGMIAIGVTFPGLPDGARVLLVLGGA
jgi:hypothetical protein